MRFARAFSILLAAALCPATPTPHMPQERNAAFNWGSQKVRGVNIGGWLVLEPWITPSIFRGYPESAGIVDEYTLCHQLGRAEALEVLKPHWDSWVHLEDFQKIKNAGFNVVRIPIGFWAYKVFSSPYAKGAAPYMDKAISWARQVGLKVIIDLHGAPASQNGFDNSGQKMTEPGWTTGASVAQTLQVLEQISAKYAKPSYQDVVIGIQLLNEPLIANLPNPSAVRPFTRAGYNAVRAISDTPVVFHDGFQAPSSWNEFLTPSDNDAQNVIIDHHEYQVFDNWQIHRTPEQHVQDVCANAKNYAGADKWTFIGEWTAAMTDCAKWLNGYGTGARYDGSFPGSTFAGSCANINFIKTWTPAFKNATRKYIEAQMEAFEAKTQGWFFWNFKTESSSEWDLFRLLDWGVFPQPLTARKFGKICTGL